MHLKTSSAKWCPFYLGGDELNLYVLQDHITVILSRSVSLLIINKIIVENPSKITDISESEQSMQQSW